MVILTMWCYLPSLERFRFVPMKTALRSSEQQQKGIAEVQMLTVQRMPHAQHCNPSEGKMWIFLKLNDVNFENAAFADCNNQPRKPPVRTHSDC